LELVRLLLKHNADINAVDDVGWSALHIASSKNYIEICIELINAGVDVNKPERVRHCPVFMTSAFVG